MMMNIVICKDILARIAATLFLVSGVILALHFGMFL